MVIENSLEDLGQGLKWSCMKNLQILKYKKLRQIKTSAKNAFTAVLAIFSALYTEMKCRTMNSSAKIT